MKKAIMLLMEVRATLVPVRFRHSPVRSCGDRGGDERGCGEVRGGWAAPGQGLVLTLKGMCWLVSVKA